MTDDQRIDLVFEGGGVKGVPTCAPSGPALPTRAATS